SSTMELPVQGDNLEFYMGQTILSNSRNQARLRETCLILRATWRPGREQLLARAANHRVRTRLQRRADVPRRQIFPRVKPGSDSRRPDSTGSCPARLSRARQKR